MYLITHKTRGDVAIVSVLSADAVAELGSEPIIREVTADQVAARILHWPEYRGHPCALDRYEMLHAEIDQLLSGDIRALRKQFDASRFHVGFVQPLPYMKSRLAWTREEMAPTGLSVADEDAIRQAVISRLRDTDTPDLLGVFVKKQGTMTVDIQGDRSDWGLIAGYSGTLYQGVLYGAVARLSAILEARSAGAQVTADRRNIGKRYILMDEDTPYPDGPDVPLKHREMVKYLTSHGLLRDGVTYGVTAREVRARHGDNPHVDTDDLGKSGTFILSESGFERCYGGASDLAAIARRDIQFLVV